MKIKPFLKKIFSQTSIKILFIPLALVLIDNLFKHTLHLEIMKNLGITLASLGLGQIIPFAFFDSLLVNKILVIEEEYSYSEDKIFTIKYPIKINKKPEEIKYLVSITNVFLTIAITFWIFSLLTSVSINPEFGFSILSLILGVLNYFIAWLYLIFL